MLKIYQYILHVLYSMQCSMMKTIIFLFWMKRNWGSQIFLSKIPKIFQGYSSGDNPKYDDIINTCYYIFTTKIKNSQELKIKTSIHIDMLLLVSRCPYKPSGCHWLGFLEVANVCDAGNESVRVGLMVWVLPL